MAEKDATLAVIWVETDPEIVHARMIQRNSDRDTWKLEHWDEYIAGCNFEVPENLRDEEDDTSLLIFHNNDADEFEESMEEIVNALEGNLVLV